ncbi:short-chain dehydrogenase [Streptomyces sp. NRRL F-4489]|uniref:SDR family oxidoreductase n=1 Tax=Streptomyces sp. NRRL F-4489 TaxID=1609095 RepID=UPI00074621F2|nr:SDR family oxidoreductase [Streptomyces sp. NRRL F-4489]KUL52331.1 short-chain dehydrogenase [Streptomyces sp. NRRL F-4489]
MGKLSGKTALVTGGGRGIGRGISERLGRDGALVAVHYGNDEAAAKETVRTIEAEGGRAFAFRTELGVPGDAEALWAAFDEQIARYDERGGLDILVNNAGVLASGAIDQIDEAAYDRVFAINTKAPFFIIKHGLTRLRDNGRIINVSSGVTKVAIPDVIAYSATKGALDTLTFTLAQGLGARGITVNAVAPGTIETDANPWVKDPEGRKQIAAVSVFNRVGRPADIGDAVAFLASDDARWITAEVIDVSGGSALGI